MEPKYSKILHIWKHPSDWRDPMAQCSRKSTIDKEDIVKMFKVLIIGESGVGKSSMMLKYVDNIYTGIYISTIGVDFKSKHVQIGKHRCKIQIWDTAGQERFRVITSTYYRGADVIILVYDVTDKRSFDKIDQWVHEIQRQCSERPPIMLLAGNKADLNCETREVAVTEGQQLAKSITIPFYETSAKDGFGINEIFRNAAEMALDRYLCEQMSLQDNRKSRSGSRAIFGNLADKIRESSFKLHHTSNNVNKGNAMHNKCCTG